MAAYDPYPEQTINYNPPPTRRRRTQMILFGLILLTLPFYLCGAVLLALAPGSEGRAVTATLPPLEAQGSLTPQTSPTHTLGTSPTPTSNITLARTPGQFVPPTRPPSLIPPSPTILTATPAPTLTSLPDDDRDSILNPSDNCPTIANPDQRDSDGDGIGDACDPSPFPPTPTPVLTATPPPTLTLTPTLAPPLDSDADGIPDSADNCPFISNPDQADSNTNGVGDACDAPTPTPETSGG